MNDSKWFSVVALATAAVVVAIGALMIFASVNLAPVASSPSASKPGPTAYLNLTIRYDPAKGAFAFTPANATIVAHTKVIVTITNHDPSIGNLYLPWDNQVIGTMGGTEVVDSGNGAHSVTSLPEHGVGHTFTILDAFYNISVPIPPAPTSSVPTVVTFQLTMGSTETTTWACMCDCDHGNMMPGMFGRLVVSE